MTVNQFLDYLASHPQTRDLGVALGEIVAGRSEASLRRTA
jgi:hypothetical protein